MSSTLWHGRFEGGPSEALQALNEPPPFDRRMFREDVAGRVPMSACSAMSGSSPRPNVTRCSWPSTGSSRRSPRRRSCSPSTTKTSTPWSSDGSPNSSRPARLHTGRSRNDQVATDRSLRRARRRPRRAGSGLLDAARALLVERGREHVDTVLPGYTHLQRAQPVAARPPLARLRGDARRGRGALRRPATAPDAGAPAGRGAGRARRCRSTARSTRREASASRARPPTAWTRSPPGRRRSSSCRRRHLHGAPVRASPRSW